VLSPYPGAERFWKRAVRLATGVLLVGAGVLYFCFPAGRALALGLLLGGAISICRYRLRYGALVRLRQAGAGALVRAQLTGYALNALALAAAFLFSHTVSPWTTIAGLLAMNVSVITTELLSGDMSLHVKRTGIGQKCR